MNRGVLYKFEHSYSHKKTLFVCTLGLPKMYAASTRFMPFQATQTTNSDASRAKNPDTHGSFPLTVKQINQFNFIVNDVEINNVELVGLVFKKVERPMDVAFSAENGTGPMDYNEIDELQSKFSDFRMNEGIDTRDVLEIKPVTDFVELAYQFKDCMYVHVPNSRLQGGVQTVPSSGMAYPMQNGSLGSQALASNQFVGQYSFDGTNGIHLVVLEYLQRPECFGREIGIHINEIVQQLNLSYDRVVQCINGLQSEGAVYSTVDDFHFRSVTDFNGHAYQFKLVLQGGVQNMTNSEMTHPMLNGLMGYQALASNQDSFDGTRGIVQKVLDYLHHYEMLGGYGNGIHIDDIVKHLNLPRDKIFQCIKDLESEGDVFSTIDDWHFRYAKLD